MNAIKKPCHPKRHFFSNRCEDGIFYAVCELCGMRFANQVADVNGVLVTLEGKEVIKTSNN